MNKTLALPLTLVILAAIVFVGVLFYKPKITKAPTTNVNTTAVNTNTTVNTNTSTISTSANIYLVAVGDDGKTGTKIGCGDSLVPVNQVLTVTTVSGDAGRVAAIKAALTALFAIHDQYYGQSGLYNALYHSNLSVSSVTVANGQATVVLAGTIELGGECDNPRVESMITQAVKQFSDITGATITLNGKTLQAALSLK